ncbi:MAG: DUF4342 domain-containing protein [Spirochaetales bacterium]|nr:DUF4342 domain-containing protein [Spirochaetales bacterium]
MEKNIGEEIKVKGEELLKKVKEIVHQGNIRKIIIKNVEGKIMLEIPLTVGVVGAAFLPVLAAVGALAALAMDFKIEIIKREEDQANKDNQDQSQSQ